GVQFGLCTGASPPPAVTRGRLYRLKAACTASNFDLRNFAWTFASDVDAQGKATVSFPVPVPGECVYLGATYRLNAQESPAIGGYVRIPATGCPDQDADGWTTCDLDCNDNNPAAHPGAAEVCDGA